MKSLICTATIQFQVQWSSPRLPQPVSLKSRFSSSCLRLEGHGNADISQSSNGEEVKQTEIWRLFKEAQQNILYLNKQRLKAVEELNKIKKENQLLLDKIEQLAKEKKAFFGKGEASDLRRVIMDQRVGVDDVFINTKQMNDVEFLAALQHFSDRSKKNALHIVHICTEMEPLVSVGSLASYITGLSHALQRKGHLVEVILPKYVSLDLDEVQGLREMEADAYSYFNGQLHANRIWTGVVWGIGVTLIEPQYYSSFLNRERVYGYTDDFERFSYFSRASLDYILKSGKQPDVLHIHNWETAIVGPLFWDIFAKQGLEGLRILLTCHNFNQQCLEQPDKLELCGLDPPRLHRPDRLQDNSNNHLVNILKGGVVYSNKVVIMSSLHSKSKIFRSLSNGLESTLNIHKDKVVISPYGFDSSTWDPSEDDSLPENYSVDDMDGKTSCKVALQQYVGFTENNSDTIVGCVVSELSDVDLKNLKSIVWSAIGHGVQFIVTMPNTNKGFESFREEFKNEDVRFVLGHDEALLHLIFAGSDIILCQSFHDPVFHVPLKALRYGAAPIALTNNRFRNFLDHDYATTKFARFISFTFGTMSLTDALDEIKNSPSKWKRKIMEGMAMDFSWDGECYEIHASAYASIKKL